MISWMQKHNKYLVITIWVATIAFIGAGFVGWGSVKFGSSANAVAKVGEIDIPITKYSFNYNNLYTQYRERFGGKFDRKKAEELGLGKVVLNNLINEALLLNFAKENGIITTDKEVGLEIANFSQFKDKNGAFDKSIYESFLRNRGLKAKDFEQILKDEMTVRKVLSLINVKPLLLESEAIESTFKIADKIRYKVLKKDEIKVEINEDELKKYWNDNKNNYLSKAKYKLELLWTKPKDINISSSEIEEFYKVNNFNYTDKDGKVKELKDVKDLVLKDIKLKKIKKEAVIERSRFKKGKLQASEVITLEFGDSKFAPSIWKELKESKSGKFLKPKAVGDSYVTIHIKNIIEPKVLSFKDAKELVSKDFKLMKEKEELNNLTKEALKSSSNFNIEPKEYITLSKIVNLPKLTLQDSAKVIRTIFDSDKGVGSVSVSEGVVVYKILEQKLLDNNSSNTINNEIVSVKNGELASNLLKELSTKYTTKVFLKDIK